MSTWGQSDPTCKPVGDKMTPVEILKICTMILLLTGCASNIERPSYAETYAQYRAMQKEIPDRVVYEFSPACNDSGECIVTEQSLHNAAKIITLLNDSVTSGITSYNAQLEALASMEAALEAERYRAELSERGMDRADTIHTIKQVLTTGAAISGSLLFCRP